MRKTCGSPLARTVGLAIGIVALLGVGRAALAGGQENVPAGVVNYTRVDATVACAGATPPDAMPGVKALGFVSVVNFRTDEEAGAEIPASRAAADKAGLKYFHLPFQTPTADVAERFLDVVANTANQPVYIHCGSANRVGAMWFIKRVKQDGWDTTRAMKEAEAIGLRSAPLKEFAMSYVAAKP